MANLDLLLSKIDLPDLAERAGAHLRRNGHEHRGTCPLHGGDNQTAFAVREEGGAQWWHCYTRCSAGGDAISFYQKWKGVEFREAVPALAALYHVSLEDIGWNQPQDVQAEARQRQRQDVLQIAAAWYAAQLWQPQGRHAAYYLWSRGFMPETIQALGWGYTSGQGLAAHLTQAGADLETARECGLIRADGRDFTANADGAQAAPHGWIVFPHRLGERVTYLTSRAVERPGQPRPDPADKSRNLPGPRQVYRCEARGCNDVTLVEGPLDAASLYQAGRSAWALCGLSSLPDDAAARLRRRPAVYLAADNDAAGQSALGSVDGLLPKSITALGPLTMVLPALYAKDFNAWQQAGTLTPDALTAHYRGAVTWLETRMDQAAVCTESEHEARMLEIGALLAMVPEASQAKYYRLAHSKLGLTRKDITALVRQAAQHGENVLGSVRDGILCFAGRPLLNGAIKITNELVMDDGQDLPRVRFTVTGRLVNGQPLEPLDIDAEEFGSFAWVPRHWGRSAILYVSKGQYYELDRAVKETSPDAKRERVYTYTGWTHIDGKRHYLSATGAVGSEGHNPDIRVDLGLNNLRHYALPCPPQGEDQWLSVQASIDFLNIGPRSVTAPLWAAMYAAPLTEIMPLYALLWVYGQTQSGKSTVVHLALTHYGPGFIQGRQYHAPIDWTSTGTAIEGAMFTAKDTPMVIDDFAPQFASAGDSREMHRKAHITIRSVGNRSSRGRARADLTARKERIPRGLVIATAENPLMGQSIVGRMIYVPIGRGEIVPLDGTQNPDLDTAQTAAQRGMYAQAMASYLQWLAANWERVARELPARIEQHVKAAREKYPTVQGRLPDYYALLTAAQELALMAFVEMGCISEYEAQREAQANDQAILDIITQQAERIATESPIRKVFEALGSLLTRKRAYLAPRTQAIEYHPPERSEMIGWYGSRAGEENQVYLDTKQALILARDYYNGLSENLDILPDAFLLQVRQAGLIAQAGEAGRDEASVWISGKTRRVLVLDKARIMALYGIELANENDLPEPPGPEDVPF